MPPSLPPAHPSPHLSAASRLPEAQSARRSGGQDSRKPCSSWVMVRTLELFTRARLSSRARLEKKRVFRQGLPGHPVTFLGGSPFPGTCLLSPLSPAAELARCLGPLLFTLVPPPCLPAEGGVRFPQTFHHGGPVPLHRAVIRLHQLQQGRQGHISARSRRGLSIPWPAALSPPVLPWYGNERLVNPEILEEGGQRVKGPVAQPCRTPGPIT